MNDLTLRQHADQLVDYLNDHTDITWQAHLPDEGYGYRYRLTSTSPSDPQEWSITTIDTHRKDGGRIVICPVITMDSLANGRTNTHMPPSTRHQWWVDTMQPDVAAWERLMQFSVGARSKPAWLGRKLVERMGEFTAAHDSFAEAMAYRLTQHDTMRAQRRAIKMACGTHRMKTAPNAVPRLQDPIHWRPYGYDGNVASSRNMTINASKPNGYTSVDGALRLPELEALVHYLRSKARNADSILLHISGDIPTNAIPGMLHTMGDAINQDGNP